MKLETTLTETQLDRNIWAPYKDRTRNKTAPELTKKKKSNLG